MSRSPLDVVEEGRDFLKFAFALAGGVAFIVAREMLFGQKKEPAPSIK